MDGDSRREPRIQVAETVRERFYLWRNEWESNLYLELPESGIHSEKRVRD